jgi:hypothetical protein
MKYAKAILGSVALFVLLDILTSVMIPEWHSHKESVGHQSGVCELPRVQFSGAAKYGDRSH